MRRGTVLVLVIASAVTGCEGSSEDGMTRPTVEGDTPRDVSVTVTGDPLDGRFHAVVGGETSNDNQLYELSFEPPEARLSTDARRVSSVGACRESVVVAAGQPEVGYSDHLQELRAGALVPLEGLGPLHAFNPELDEDCRVAYTWVDRDTDTLVSELRVWDPRTATNRTWLRGEPGDGPLASPDWGPRDAVAVVRHAPRHAGERPAGAPVGRPAAVLVVAPDGDVSALDTRGDPSILTWGARWIAVMEEEQQATVFIDPDDGERVVLPGWRPVTWSPDGNRALVKDAATRRVLGIVDAADPLTVKEVGRLSAPLLDAVWLPA